jgi:signal peptidase I
VTDSTPHDSSISDGPPPDSVAFGQTIDETVTGTGAEIASFDDETGELDSVAVQPPRQKKSLPFWLELPILVGVALIVAVVIKTFLFQAFFIPSGSMKDTLQIDDRVLVNKIAYSFSDLKIGDVVVFDDPRAGFEAPTESVLQSAVRNLTESVGLATPQSEFIKRVVGLPGDTVNLIDNQLYVNDVPVDEPYLAPDAQPPSVCSGSTFGPIVVPDDHIMVMGDNRCHSSDGRVFGPVPSEDIVGKAFVIIWPISRWSGI